MQTNFQSRPEVAWEIRGYRDGDIPAIVALINTIDAVDGLDEGRSEDEISSRFHSPDSDPYRSVIVVSGPPLVGVTEGTLVGAGAYALEPDAVDGSRSYILRFWAHPAARERGLELVLVERLTGMVRENEARPELQPTNSVTVFAATRDDKPGRRELLEGLGMSVAREFWHMARPLDRPVDEPASVPGVTIRTYRRPEDNAAATAAYNDSFRDHWDHHDSTVESWDHTISAPSRRPDLSWVAEVDGEPGNLGGFCLCVIHEPDNLRSGRKEGWIELLATTRAWRGKGLGKSLLLHGLRSLKSAGLDTALLGVDSISPTGANKLYESVGFTVRHRDTIYCRDLREFQF